MAPIEPEPAEVERKPHESGNVDTFLVGSGASGHYFDDTIIPDPKHCLRNYTPLGTPRTMPSAGSSLLDRRVEGVFQGLVANDNIKQYIARIIIVIVQSILGAIFPCINNIDKGHQFRFYIFIHPDWRRAKLPFNFVKRTTMPTPSS